MTIKNKGFEDGDGIPTDWTLTTAGTDNYAEFSSFGGGVESFYWGWPTENHIFDWTELPTSPRPAEFDNAVNPFETWILQWIEAWEHASGSAALFNVGADNYDSFEWYAHYTTVPGPVTAMFGIVNPYESFENTWWITLPGGGVAAQFDDKWGGGGAPQPYEDFEP